MLRLTSLGALLIVMTATAAPPWPTRVLTYPDIPAKTDLDRLNLQLAWQLQLPCDYVRNGIGSIQYIGKQLYIQLRDGTIAAIDAESGKLDWTERVTSPYPVTRRLGHDPDLVFALDVNRLVALEKKNGAQRWTMELPDVPVAPPMAGEYLLYIPFANGRVLTYALPETTVAALEKNQKERKDLSRAVAKIRSKIDTVAPLLATGVDLRAPVGGAAARTSSATGLVNRSATTSMALHKSASYVTKPATAAQITEAGKAPYFLSSRSPGFRVDHPVLVDSLGLVFSGNGRETLTIRKNLDDPFFKFSTDHPLAMPPVLHGIMGYFVSVDGSIYSVDMAVGKVNWRFAAPDKVRDPLLVTDDAVYLSMAQRGSAMLNRQTGVAGWFQPEAQLILAANKSFVYAKDRFGRLLVLNRGNGAVLSDLDLSKFNVPLVNEHNDRIVLAANDGTVICLHDRGQAAPLSHEGPKVAAPKLIEKIANSSR